MKKAQYIIASAAAVALIGGVVALNLDHSAINGGKIESSMQIDNGDLKINWNNYQTYDIELSNTYTITNSGTYHFTGSLTNGSIVVKAAESDVRIILDNVTITNTSGPAIIAYAANDVVIELVGENTLEDASKYSTDLDEDITGAIYSKDDLTFQGDGTLNLVANYEDGIVAKDDLKFSSGTYNIVAVDDGIRGKDSVYIVDGREIFKDDPPRFEVERSDIRRALSGTVAGPVSCSAAFHFSYKQQRITPLSFHVRLPPSLKAEPVHRSS